MELQELLNNLKSRPSLGLDIKAKIKENKKIADRFKNKYPNLFSECFGFDLPSGWVNICETVFSELNGQSAKVLQVKQKFGDLIIHLKDGRGERVAERALLLARNVCEFCGSTDNVSLWEEGYIARVCIECKLDLAQSTVIYWILEGVNEWKHDYARKVLQDYMAGEVDREEYGFSRFTG